MKDQDKILKARELGELGYKTGKQAPAQDAQLLALFNPDSKIGDPLTVKLMNAWFKGYRTEARKEKV